MVKVATAVLSTTAKVKAREKKKAAAENDGMDVVSVLSVFSSHLLTFNIIQDDKAEAKKEGDVDVEMKADEGASTKHGDVSPMEESISNLPEESKVSGKRKGEPSSETLQNFSRVTPAQLAYIAFPPQGRYQPVRAVSSKPFTKGKASLGTLGSKQYGGGGGILILRDLHPEEEAEFIDLEPPPQPQPTAAANGHAIVAPAPSGPHIALDPSAPEADPPSAFEVRDPL